MSEIQSVVFNADDGWVAVLGVGFEFDCAGGFRGSSGDRFVSGGLDKDGSASDDTWLGA